MGEVNEPDGEPVRFAYFELGRGRVTAAIRADEAGTVHIGVAFCSPRDQFSKRRGRAIAHGRLVCPHQGHYHFHLLRDPRLPLKAQVGKLFCELQDRQSIDQRRWFDAQRLVHDLEWDLQHVKSLTPEERTARRQMVDRARSVPKPLPRWARGLEWQGTPAPAMPFDPGAPEGNV